MESSKEKRNVMMEIKMAVNYNNCYQFSIGDGCSASCMIEDNYICEG